mmetsp:Transcript_6203/g.13358  ORF Transcript_6203/g.13358 Transcript_6203/m.13358 type:complete len:86 (+) Transcript_6203:1614-1871(+)
MQSCYCPQVVRDDPEREEGSDLHPYCTASPTGSAVPSTKTSSAPPAVGLLLAIRRVNERSSEDAARISPHVSEVLPRQPVQIRRY